VRHLDLSPGERIVSFKIALTGAVIQDIVKLPIGWHLIIDNNSSWQTSISGDSIVGAAALYANEFQKPRATVLKDDSALKFTASGVVSVTKDWDKFREISLKAEGFAIDNPH
jgi:hypothetical protein